MAKAMLSNIDAIREEVWALQRRDWTQGAAIAAVAGAHNLKPRTVLRYVQAAAAGMGPLKPTEDAVARQLLDKRLRDVEHQLRLAKEEAVTSRAVREQIFKLRQPEEEGVPAWVARAHDGDDPGTPTLFLSDLHAGEVVEAEQVFNVNEFNLDLFNSRLEKVVTTADMLLGNHLTHGQEYEGIVLSLGGDMVSGDIHEELSATNEAPIMTVVRHVAQRLLLTVRFLSSRYRRVHILGVPGNHGRITRKPRFKFTAATNFDWLIYTMLEDLINAAGLTNVTCQFPPVRDITYTLAGRRYRLSHGDQFRGGDSIIGALGPITRGDKRKRAQAATLPGRADDYDTLTIGHWHTYHPGLKVIVNGSLKGWDEYALGNGFEYEPPIQALWTTHPRLGINFIMPVFAEAPRAPAKEGSLWTNS